MILKGTQLKYLSFLGYNYDNQFIIIVPLNFFIAELYMNHKVIIVVLRTFERFSS